MKVRYARLEKLATILDAADAEHKKKGEPTYNQNATVHPCGTPACAIGHWAVNNKRRWHVNPDFVVYKPLATDDHFAGLDFIAAAEKEFGIGFNQAEELFNERGCGNARTAKAAARYIRKFIKRLRAEGRK